MHRLETRPLSHVRHTRLLHAVDSSSCCPGLPWVNVVQPMDGGALRFERHKDFFKRHLHRAIVPSPTNHDLLVVKSRALVSVCQYNPCFEISLGFTPNVNRGKFTSKCSATCSALS